MPRMLGGARRGTLPFRGRTAAVCCTNRIISLLAAIG
jgi:hypothetical protein